MDMDMELPGPDYIRVLAVLPKDGRQWLVDAARALLEGRAWRIEKTEAELPADFELDQSFFSVALGPTAPSEFNFERDVDKIALANDLKPENSRYFVIRGFVKARGPQLPRNIDDLELYSDPSIHTLLTCGTDPAVGSVVDLRNNLGTTKLAAQLPMPLDGAGVAVAMVDSGIFLQHLTRVNLLTGLNEALRMRPRSAHPLPPRPLGDPPILDVINSWTPPRVVTPPGGHRIGHGTMCAYNVLAVAPRARLLDYPSLIAQPGAGRTVPGTVGAATQAYALLIAFWINNPAMAVPYRALVVNNSWGIFHPCEEYVSPGQPGRFIDDPFHLFHVLVWYLAKLGADIVFAAGNGGMPCPAPPFLHLTTGSIRGANAYKEVLTVAGCDVNDSRVGYSSQGPAVAMFPLPTPEKPDLAAYTHFLGSQVFGERQPDGGTSTACPIAAGCVAALRSHPNIAPAAVPPAALFGVLRNTARQVGAAGWNRDYGYGIIDPVAAARFLGVPIP
jgi:subtilisin family serine protease